MQQNSKKIGVALSGGSTYGIAHIGVLKALIENDIPIDYISGTSAGAFVAACYAFNVSIDQMINLTGKMNWKKLSRFAYSKLGLNSNSPMGSLLTEILGDALIEEAITPLAIVATNIENHKMVVLRSGNLSNAVRASTCIPGFFTPIEIDGALLVDGGLTENLPLSPLDDMGAEIKIGVNLIGHQQTFKPRNVWEMINASIAILSEHRDKEIHAKADFLIEPNLQQFDLSKFNQAEAMLEEGYRACMEILPSIRKQLQKEEETFSQWFKKIVKRYVL